MSEQKERILWGLIRIRLNAAGVALVREGECCPFVQVWQEICHALVEGYGVCRMAREEMAEVWLALVEAEYPGFQGASQGLFEEYWQAMSGSQVWV